MNGAANSNAHAAGASMDSPADLRAQIDALKAQLALLDERREHMLKSKPTVKKAPRADARKAPTFHAQAG